jgi:hypothetical protein
MYELPVSSTGKVDPADQARSPLRTRRKRRFKKAVSEQVCQTFRDVALRRARPTGSARTASGAAAIDVPASPEG